MINSTDVRIEKNMYVSLQAKYKFPGTVQMFKEVVKSAKETVLKDMLARIEHKSGYSVVFYLSNLKTNNTQGQCFIFGKKIIVQLAPKLVGNVNIMAEILGHELVHAEQFLTGKLKWVKDAWYWGDRKAISKGTTYAAYRQLPWEVEAFARQEENKAIILEHYFKRS